MVCTDWLASQSDLIDMTYKVVHIKAMNVGFRFLGKKIQNSNGFVTDVQFKMKRLFWSVGSRATGGYETVTYLNIFLLKNKANIHAVILNHFIGPYDFFWLTDSRVSHVHIIILIYFYMVDWLASQWVSSHCYDLLSGFSWRPGCRLLIAQKNISKFQRFRNWRSTYLK